MQQNIYFRKDVWDKFGKEKKKSELVNKLLEAHYKKIHSLSKGMEDSFKYGDGSGESSEYTKVSETVIKAPEIIKTKEDVPFETFFKKGKS